MAVIDPRAASTLAAQMTAVVDPTADTIDPMQEDRMNWAKNTMDDIMATSVPRPRTCCSGPAQSPSTAMNCGASEEVMVVMVRVCGGGEGVW